MQFISHAGVSKPNVLRHETINKGTKRSVSEPHTSNLSVSVGSNSAAYENLVSVFFQEVYSGRNAPFAMDK